jgi:predicted amidophosphoribosyltransferase
VKAIKGEEVNGFAYLNLGGILYRLDRSTALQDVVAYVGKAILAEVGERLSEPHYLVPIPNSSCTTTHAQQPKVCSLANAIASLNGTTKVWDGLRWGEERLKSSMGGNRNRKTLLENYRSLGSVPQDAPVILLDDVATTGNHLLAAGDFLRARGADCQLAIVVGRTVHDTSQKALGALLETL